LAGATSTFTSAFLMMLILSSPFLFNF